MTIKSINKSFYYDNADSYPVGFYSAHKIVMPEEGWLVKVGGVCVSNSGGTFKFFITTQETPGIGDPKASLLWSGATTFTALANSTAAVFEENVDNIHVISGQELFICMYAESGDARFGYSSSSGNVILDGPYGGGPVPPTVPLSGYSQYDDYRYAQWIEYDDTDPGGGPLPLNKFKYWDGSQWLNKPLGYWNGTDWVEKIIRRWTGSGWVPALAGGAVLIASAIYGASGSSDITPDFTTSGYRWANFGGGSQEVVGDALRLTFDPDPVDSGYYGPTLGLFIDDPSIQLQDVYVQFEARFPSNINGCKFVKFFGRRDGENYSNATFNLLWATGEFANVIFTDGTDLAGDAGRALFFSGGNTSLNVGRAWGTAVISTPQNSSFDEAEWGNTWHTFKFRYKQNSGTTSGNEVADGVFYVEIDGNVYLSATNMFNRNHANGLYLEKIEFGGWSQDGGGAFQLEFRNIKISSGGFV